MFYKGFSVNLKKKKTLAYPEEVTWGGLVNSPTRARTMGWGPGGPRVALMRVVASTQSSCCWVAMGCLVADDHFAVQVSTRCWLNVVVLRHLTLFQKDPRFS